MSRNHDFVRDREEGRKEKGERELTLSVGILRIRILRTKSISF